jgi:glycine cleavage system H protein
MSDCLETTVDKFHFKVAGGRRYTPEGLWAKLEGDLVRIGVSDYFQQRNGDVAFAELMPVGMTLAVGDEIATIETIKVDIELPSPVAGEIAAVNEELELAAELINQDPYGEGWLALVRPSNWEADEANPLDSIAYFAHMKNEAEQEAAK